MRGDLAEANQAQYARQVLKSQGYPGWLHFLDFVIYRGIAGYFVRPFRPLIALLAVASVFTLVRVTRTRVRAPAKAWPGHASSPRGPRTLAGVTRQAARGVALAVRALGEFASLLLATLTLIVPARKGSEPERQSRQIEVWIYRALFACALIGFANSNATLRDMFDAVR